MFFLDIQPQGLENPGIIDENQFTVISHEVMVSGQLVRPAASSWLITHEKLINHHI